MPSESMAIDVTTESDATPLVRVIANQLRLSLRSYDVGSNFTACVTLQDVDGNRAVNLVINGPQVRVANGTAKSSDLTVVLDFDNPAAPTKLNGAWRHPLKALKIASLLSQPGPNWADSAKRFWSVAGDQPELPECLVVNCTNEDRELSFGSGSHKIEIHGHSSSLNQAFTGENLIALMVVTGQLQFRGSMQDLAYLSQVGQRIMLDDAHG